MTPIYIKLSENNLVQKHQVTIGDVATIFCTDQATQKDIENIYLYNFSSTKTTEVIISVMKIIELIMNKYPDAKIINLGETDFILKYEMPKSKPSIKEICSTIFLCLVAFIGGGYAIMAYNTDVGAKELFTYFSMLILGDPSKGVLYLSITYALGLTAGMILFFNHIGNKKITKDPTPLEVQMRLYEKDVVTAIIQDKSRNNQEL